MRHMLQVSPKRKKGRKRRRKGRTDEEREKVNFCSASDNKVFNVMEKWQILFRIIKRDPISLPEPRQLSARDITVIISWSGKEIGSLCRWGIYIDLEFQFLTWSNAFVRSKNEMAFLTSLIEVIKILTKKVFLGDEIKKWRIRVTDH